MPLPAFCVTIYIFPLSFLLVVWVEYPITRGENLHDKLMLSLRFDSQYSDLSPTKTILKKDYPKSHDLKKSTTDEGTTDEGTTSKGKYVPPLGHHPPEQPQSWPYHGRGCLCAYAEGD